MEYVKNAMTDLQSAIDKQAKAVSLAELELKQKTSDKPHISRLEQSTVELMKSDLMKIEFLQEMLQKGNVFNAYEYAGRLETACRDLIPTSTYELIGGRLIHRKDMLFESRVVDHDFMLSVQKILNAYTEKDTKLAAELEYELEGVIEPYMVRKVKPNGFKNSM